MNAPGNRGPGPTRLAPWRLQCLINLGLDDDAAFARTAGWLLDRTRQMWRDLTDTDPVSAREVLLEWSAQPKEGRSWTSNPRGPGDSTKSFARLHESLQRGGGGLAMGWFWAAAPDGVWRPPLSLLASSRQSLDATFATINLQTHPHATEDDVAAAERALIALLEDAVIAGLPVTFANVTDDNQDDDVTAFDEATMGKATAVSNPQEYARSYSWVTYLPELLASRLGDPGSIARHHGLFRADPLGDGLIVQSTEHLVDHTGSSVMALRRALDAVIEPRPTLKPARGFTSGLRVVWDDGTIGPLDHGRLEGTWSQVMSGRT